MRSPVRWMGRSLGAAVLVVLGPGSLAGQGSVPDSLARRMDAVFAEYARPGSPGCALGVYRDGRIVYAKGYGSANLEVGAPLTPASVFDIGSTSKQFTAMSVLLLARDGKLGLDDDVRRHVPELPDYGRTITIRHLLHHTSGLRDYTTLLVLAGHRIENVTTDADALDILGRQRALSFPPGAKWEYSNSGYFLLSIIVKRVSGHTLRRFAQTRIFEPLRMAHTHVHDDHSMVVPNRATGYAPGDSTGPFRVDMSNWEQTGDGSVLTTVEDLLRWDQNFYSGAMGGSALLTEMVQPGRLGNGETLDYAAGLFVGEYRGLKTVAHGGAWAGYRAQLLRFPTEHASVACLCNLGSANAGTLAHQVADVYLADRLGPLKDSEVAGAAPGATSGSPALPPEQLSAIVGTYRDPKEGGVVRIALTEGKLQLNSAGASLELQPISPVEFRLIGQDARLHVEPAASDRPRRIRLSGPGVDQPTFEAIAAVRPSAAALAGYTGDYFSPELQATYRIGLERGRLVLHLGNLPAAALEPTIRDEFESSAYGLALHFSRRSGPVNGFTLATGGIRDMRFDRRPAGRSR